MTYAEIRKYWLDRDPRCVYCQRRFRHAFEITLDHYIPKSLRGKRRLNLVLCCRKCNTAKGDKLPLDFINSECYTNHNHRRLIRRQADARIFRLRRDRQLVILPARRCEECKGFGGVPYYYQDDDMRGHHELRECDECEGRGYVII